MRCLSLVRFSPLLTRVGRKLGIDAHYFAKNSAFILLGQIVYIIKGLITGYLITLLFPPQMYGEYRFVLSMVGAIGVLSLSGVGTAVSRAIVTQKEKAPLRHTLFWYTIFCSGEFLLTLGVIPFLHRYGHLDLWPLFVIAAVVSLPYNVAAIFFGGIVTGEGNFGKSLKANLLINLLVMASVLLMLLVQPSAVLLLALTIGIPTCVLLWFVRRQLQRYPSTKKDWSTLRYGFQMTLATVPMGIANYIDSMLISAFFGLHQLAAFSVAQMIPEQVKTLSKDFLPIAFSRQARGKATHARRVQLFKTIAVMTVVFAVGILFYIAVAPWLMPILFPKYGLEQILLLTDVAAINVITLPLGLCTQYLEARGMVKELQSARWYGSILLCILLVVLVPTLGPIGALIGRGIFRLEYGVHSAILVWRSKETYSPAR